MLETVTQGFQAATERLRGVRALDEENIAESLRDVRASLLVGCHAETAIL